MKKYYSVKEASEILDVSTNTVYKYVKKEKIRSKRIGKGRIKIPASELEPFLDTQKSGQQNQQDPQASDEAGEDTDAGKVSSKGDFIFFKLFLAVSFIGTGVLTLLYRLSLFTPYDQALPIDGSLSTIFLILPFITMLPGILILLEIFKRSSFDNDHWWVHVLELIVSGYMAYFSLSFKGYEAFSFFAAIFIVLIGQVFQRFKGLEETESFEREFLKLLFFTVTVLTIINLVISDVYVLLPFAEQFLPNKGLFSLSLMVFLGLPTIVLFIPKVKNTIDFLVLPYMAFVAVVIGILLTSQGKWLAGFYAYTIVVFTVFMLWHRKQNLKSTKRLTMTGVHGVLWSCFIVLLGVVGLVFSQKVAINSYFESVESRLSEVENDINFIFDNADRQLTASISQQNVVSVIEEADTEQATLVSKSIFDGSTDLRRAVILDEQGSVLGVYPREPLLSGIDLGSRKYFKDSKNNLSPQTTDIFTAVTGVSIVIRTQPVTKDNRFVGLLLAVPDLVSISRDYNKTGSASMYGYDTGGKYVIHPDTSMLGESVPQDIIEESKSGVHRDVYSYRIYEQVEDVGWTVYQQGQLSEALNDLFGVDVFIGFLVLINSTLAYGVLTYVTRRWK